MITSDLVYVLCASYHSADGDGNMYIAGKLGPETDAMDKIVTRLAEAQIFDTRSDAWHYKENECHSPGWQVVSFTRKRLFEARLAGK